MKRLFGAIIQGIGWSAGRDIYEEGKKKVRQELDRLPAPKTPKQLAKEAQAAEKARVAADKERAAAAQRREKAAEDALAALKRKMGR
jgi:hypothetical protein